MLKVAIARGANHYRRDFDPTLLADLPAISDEEIGVALCLGQNPYSLDALRVAAQFLSSPRINAARLCRLAEQERCEPVLLHIAEVAKKYAPEQEPWAYVRQHLLPHTCYHALCRARTLCRTGRASSATPGLRGKARHALTGSAAMNNPLHILQTLDHHLTKPAEITIFGRAALALGFPSRKRSPQPNSVPPSLAPAYRTRRKFANCLKSRSPKCWRWSETER